MGVCSNYCGNLFQKLQEKTRGPGPRLMHPPPKKSKKKIFKNGVLGRFWADLDCRFEFYVKNYVGWWVQICFLSIFENLVIWQFGYPAFYQAISIKSTFEPITTPLKWVLADAACKVSMIFFNIASGLCWEMPNGVKFLIFLGVFGFSRLRVKSCRCFLIYSFNRWVSGPNGLPPEVSWPQKR